MVVGAIVGGSMQADGYLARARNALCGAAFGLIAGTILSMAASGAVFYGYLYWGIFSGQAFLEANLVLVSGTAFYAGASQNSWILRQIQAASSMVSRVFQRTRINVTLVEENAAEDTVTLYRGVNQSHALFGDSQAGIVRPNGGIATPLEHNTVPGATLDSPYTSWTPNQAIAEKFALRPNGQGLVIQADIPISQITQSPNLKQVVLIQNGQIVSESEVLVRGSVQGSTHVVRRP